MKSATVCGIKLRENSVHNFDLRARPRAGRRVHPGSSATITCRNGRCPNLAAPTWPLNSRASKCEGAIPARPASRAGCSTCPSKQSAEFAHKKTAEYVEAG